MVAGGTIKGDNELCLRNETKSLYLGVFVFVCASVKNV